MLGFVHSCILIEIEEWRLENIDVRNFYQINTQILGMCCRTMFLYQSTGKRAQPDWWRVHRIYMRRDCHCET